MSRDDDYEDLPSDRATIDAFLLDGLTIPEKMKRGRPNNGVAEAWLELVETIMGRGITSPYRLSLLLDVPYATADGWIKRIHKKWGDGLGTQELNWRREELYREADNVAQMAWAAALTAEIPKDRAEALGMILKANARKAKLCGLDTIKVSVKTETTVKATIDVVASVEQRFALAPGALAELGRQASILFSTRALTTDDDVVDAELADDDDAFVDAARRRAPEGGKT